jgi:hypothetical protein
MSKTTSVYKDSRWQQKRLEIMERDKWTCRSCGKSGEGVTLNVHHAYYESGRKPWEYDNEMLITWCEDCHAERHEGMRHFQLFMAAQNIAVASRLWLLAEYEMVNTLVALQPGVSDDTYASAIEAVNAAYEEGQVAEAECKKHGK